MRDPNFLQTLWFVLIGVLWVGYFVLEGFDFGVGMLLRVIGRDEVEKRVIIHTIGPVWDGNEVWLLTAGGATFAAFPGWYASLFSGFYLALFLILVALIIRGVSFEFWGKDDSPRWRATWEWTATIGSFMAALLWGVGWANIVHGVPMNSQHNVTAKLWDLLHPYALLGGLVDAHAVHRPRRDLPVAAHDVASCSTGPALLRGASRRSRPSCSPVSSCGPPSTSPLVAVKASAQVLAAACVICALGATVTLGRRQEGRAFAFSAAAIVLLFVSLFAELFPDALPSTTSHAFTLTLSAASSSHYTQIVMTVVAVIFVPIVLLYQGWTYWVFRHRLGVEDFEGTPTPIAVLQSKLAQPRPASRRRPRRR